MTLSQKLTKESISPYFDQWEALSEEISAMHRNRQKHTGPPMHEGIELLKTLIEHCDGQLIPMNGNERIQFIEQRPSNYAAFRQLDELFSEMKKKIASKRIQLKNE